MLGLLTSNCDPLCVSLYSVGGDDGDCGRGTLDIDGRSGDASMLTHDTAFVKTLPSVFQLKDSWLCCPLNLVCSAASC